MRVSGNKVKAPKVLTVGCGQHGLGVKQRQLATDLGPDKHWLEEWMYVQQPSLRIGKQLNLDNLGERR